MIRFPYFRENAFFFGGEHEILGGDKKWEGSEGKDEDGRKIRCGDREESFMEICSSRYHQSGMCR